MWPPCCIFLNREPRWQQCSSALADRAKQHNDDLEDRAISAAGFTVFTLSGRMKAEQVAGLKELFDTDYRSIILDLQEMRLADRDAVKFLRSCERDGMTLENCPAYVREWMDREED
jgi:hypothetical protein